MSEDNRLRELRERIDTLDMEIQDLISERARCAQKAAKSKERAGAKNFYSPEREAQVLRRVITRNKGPLSDEEVVRLFRELMSACLALEALTRIAFLGPEGTFTQEAALKHFGHSVETLALRTIDEVFREVESDNAHFGVVPVENSTEGVVTHTLDMFMSSPLKICGEVTLRVHHHLLGKVADPKQAKRVMSHQQSLAQCREWLDANLPNVDRVTVSSNAEAARLVSEDSTSVAIAGDSAGQIYQLDVLASNIEDDPDNTTRFLVIGKLDTKPSGDDKTSLLLSGKNKPGALHALLAPFSQLGINMTRIESRPSRQTAWEYVFFVDIDGHLQDKKVQQALAELQREAALCKCLGSYPKAVV
ncbi:MAG: prephenate dehydratase [Acidiferrobacterales bacterium]